MFSRRHQYRRQPCSIWVDNPQVAKPRVAEWLEDRTLLTASAASELFGRFTIQLTSIEAESADDSTRPFAASFTIVNLTLVVPENDIAALLQSDEFLSLAKQDSVSTVRVFDLAALGDQTEIDTESVKAAFDSDATFQFTGELHFDNEFSDATLIYGRGLIDTTEVSSLELSSDSANVATNSSAPMTAYRLVASSFRVSDDSGNLIFDSRSANQSLVTMPTFDVTLRSPSVSSGEIYSIGEGSPLSIAGADEGSIVDSGFESGSMVSGGTDRISGTPTDSDQASLDPASRPQSVASGATYFSSSTASTATTTLGQQGFDAFADFAPSGSTDAVVGEEVGRRRFASYSQFIVSSADPGSRAVSGDSPTTAIAAGAERSLTEFSANIAGVIEVTQQFEGNWIEPFQPLIGMTGSLLLAVQSLGKGILLGVFGVSGSGDGPLAAFVEPIIEQADAHFFEAPDRWELKTVEPQFEATFTRLAHSERHFEIRNIGPVADAASIEISMATSFSIVSAPQHGQVDLTASRSMRFHYQPDPGFSGVDSFRYRATAADGTSVDGIIIVTVKSGSQSTDLRTASLANDSAVEINIAALDTEQTGHRFDDVVDSFQSFEEWRGDLD